jgi:hypothetical protein
MYTPDRDEPEMKNRGDASAGTMTNRLGNQEPRRIACSACGTDLTCSLTGACWCAEETARLPMPVAGEDCLCRDCLRKMADEARRNAAG